MGLPWAVPIEIEPLQEAVGVFDLGASEGDADGDPRVFAGAGADVGVQRGAKVAELVRGRVGGQRGRGTDKSAAPCGR